MRMTHATVQAALALMENPTGKQWGYELSKRSGVRTGVLYPILHRMLAEGWLTDGWEEQPDLRRPPRRFYELTDAGARELGALLARAQTDRRFATAPITGFARFALPFTALGCAR
jgi:PadR family transcriptional regulator PadR